MMGGGTPAARAHSVPQLPVLVPSRHLYRNVMEGEPSAGDV